MKPIALVTAALLLGTPAAFAQEGPRAPRILEEKPGLTVVLDDDGGRVETFRRGDAPRALEYHGGAVLKQPLAQLVFLGDWSRLGAEKRALERSVAGISAASELERAGVTRPLVIAGSREVAGPATMNDLNVRATLAALPLRDAELVYVVFAAPSVQATLGGATSFDSYHSHFHADDGHVRYVFVPFNNVKVMSEAAARSLARAIVNPDGDGWY